MTPWQRGLRAYWELMGVPVGFAANVYGNRLYDSPYERLGLVLFFGGLALELGGMPALIRFVDEDPLRKGYERVGMLGLLLFFLVAGPTFVVAKAFWGVAQPGDYRATVAPLGLIYFALPMAIRWAEPKDFALRRLPSRIQRAAIFRTVANGAGIGAVAAFLNARFAETYPAPLISTVFTLVVAMAVVTHKTFARTRKLCTQTHIDVQNLLRDMNDLDDAKSRDRVAMKPPRNSWPRPPAGQGVGEKQADLQMAARRSWDALKLDLCTTIDSGYRLIGLPFLTDDAIADLERKVLVGIKAADPDATASARDDLHAILNACAARIDVLA